MSDWLFDLGNTRLKHAERLGDGGIGEMHALDHHRGETFGALPPVVRGETAWLAGVASPALQAKLLDVLLTRFARVGFARTHRACAGLRIAYAEPVRLGVDRFLSMLAAVQTRQDVLVVGVGTALTLDLVDAEGRHLGGRIAPSPTLMRESLHARAAQLPVEGGDYIEFAHDTRDALASGCEGAALALIEHGRQHAAQRLGRLPRLWLHGGGAPALQPRLTDAALHPALVLQGLARYAALGDAESASSAAHGRDPGR